MDSESDLATQFKAPLPRTAACQCAGRSAQAATAVAFDSQPDPDALTQASRRTVLRLCSYRTQVRLRRSGSG